MAGKTIWINFHGRLFWSVNNFLPSHKGIVSKERNRSQREQFVSLRNTHWRIILVISRTQGSQSKGCKFEPQLLGTFGCDFKLRSHVHVTYLLVRH